MDPLDLLNIPRRRWRVLAACVLLAVAAGLVGPGPKKVVVAHPGVAYKATATVNGVGADAIPGYVLLFKSDAFHQRVALHMHLPAAAAAYLKPVLSAKGNPLNSTLAVSGTSSNAVLAANVANAGADEFVAYIHEQNQLGYQAQLDAAKRQVDQLNALIANYQQGAGPARGRASGGSKSPAGIGLGQLRRDYAAAAAHYFNLTLSGPPYIGVSKVIDALAVPVPAKSFGRAATTKKGLRLPKSRRVRMVFAVVIGFVLGLILTFVVDRLDSRFWTRADVEQRLGVPVVAEIPALPKWLARRRRVVTAEEPRSRFASAFRSLRATLLSTPRRVLMLDRASSSLAGGTAEGGADGEMGAPKPGAAMGTSTRSGLSDDVQVVMVASAGPLEGRTSTVLNLAVCLAEVGKSVLVLGFDFNNRDLADWMGLPREPGVSDVLMGARDEVALDRVARPSAVPNIRVVPCGGRVGNPTLYLDAARTLIRKARRLADIVLIDTAPALVTYDAVDLVPEVDSVILVARAGRTKTTSAAQLIDLLARVESPLLGVALVGVRPPRVRSSGWSAFRRPTRRRQPRLTSVPPQASGPDERHRGEPRSPGSTPDRVVADRFSSRGQDWDTPERSPEAQPDPIERSR